MIEERLARPPVDPDLWFQSIYATPLLLAGIADLDGLVLDANQRAAEGVGYSRDLVVGHRFWDGPWWGNDAGVRRQVRQLCERAAAGGRELRAETRWWLPDGSQRYVDLAISPTAPSADRPGHLFLSGLDISKRVQAERELSAHLELTRRVLDSVADGIYGLDTEGRLVFVNRAAVDLLGYRPGELLGTVGHHVFHRAADGSLSPISACPAVRALDGVPVESPRETFLCADGTLLPVELIAAPTFADGRVTGAVVSFRDIRERIAARAQADQLRALAQAHSANRALAEALQKALLTAPPRLPHVRLAVRYRPASEIAAVGGDWYDAFAQPDGSLMLVIGDVMGHDSSAAAAMGQLRGLLRGISYASAKSPAEILRSLDSAEAGLGLGVIASVVIARVEPARPGERGRRVTWSNAGHPPPALLRPGGPAELLSTRADLLLGVRPGCGRTDHELVLAERDVLVMYTDGLVERRDRDIDDSINSMIAAAEGLGSDDLEAFCDALLHLQGRDGVQEDDVALVAVSVNA